MSTLPALYRHSLALLTDLYQLTMAAGFWQAGKNDRRLSANLDSVVKAATLLATSKKHDFCHC